MEIRQRLELEDVEALVDVVELLPLLPLLLRPLRVDGVAAAGCGGDVNNCAPA